MYAMGGEWMTAVKRKKRAARGHQPGCGVLNLRNCPLDLRQALKVEALRLGVTLEALCVGYLGYALDRAKPTAPGLGADGPKISNKGGGARRAHGAAVETGTSEELDRIVATAMGDPGLRGLPEGATCNGGADEFLRVPLEQPDLSDTGLVGLAKRYPGMEPVVLIPGLSVCTPINTEPFVPALALSIP